MYKCKICNMMFGQKWMFDRCLQRHATPLPTPYVPHIDLMSSMMSPHGNYFQLTTVPEIFAAQGAANAKLAKDDSESKLNNRSLFSVTTLTLIKFSLTLSSNECSTSQDL